MRPIARAITVPLAMVLLVAPAGAAGPPAGPLKKCPADSVVSGAGCMDKYEASVWRVSNPTTANRGLVARIQQAPRPPRSWPTAGRPSSAWAVRTTTRRAPSTGSTA